MADEVTASHALPPVSLRWLKSHELFSILSNPASYTLSLSPHPPLFSPRPGSLYLYDKRQCKRWRYDHHQWRTPERHVKLKVNGQQRINALYSHSREQPGFSRRGYWLLEQSDIVLVHYLHSHAEDALDDELTVKKEVEERKEDIDDDEKHLVQLPSLPVAYSASMTFTPPLSPHPLDTHPANADPYDLMPLPFPSPHSPSSPTLIDLSPGWDYTAGGARLLLVCSNSQLFHAPALHCVFHERSLAVTALAVSGVYSVIAPAWGEAGRVDVHLSDGRLRTASVPFDYRKSASTGMDSGGSGFVLPRVPSIGEGGGSHGSSGTSTPRYSDGRVNGIGGAGRGREFLSALLGCLMAIERAMLLSSTSASTAFQSTFSLEDIQQVVQSHPSEDLLEGLLLSILHSSLPVPPSSPASCPVALKYLSHADARGRQLIHYCTALHFVHLVAFLLDSGLHIDAPDSAGRTPLHYAAQYGDEETVAAILAFGADVERRDAAGRRAIEVARELERQRVVAVLEEVEEVEAEEKREKLYQWEEEDDDGDAERTQPTQTIGSPSAASLSLATSSSYDQLSQPQSVLPYTSALTPSSSSLSVSTPVSPSHRPPELDVAFSQLTLSDMGINTSALHSSLVHPTSPSHFHSLVRDTQRQLRWWLYRRHYAALKLQAAARGMLVRRSMKRMRESAVVIQRVVRRRRERKAATGQRFQGVVEELQERVRRKREHMDGDHDEHKEMAELEAIESAPSGADHEPVLDPFFHDASQMAQMMPLSPMSTAMLETHDTHSTHTLH